MCPTRFGRLHTRAATIWGPALLGLILSLASGNEGYIVLIGVYFLMGCILDIVVYPQIFRWQPPWMTFTIAITEFVILLCLAAWLDVGLAFWNAVIFYWISWIIANWTKVVLLPIVSLSWIENGGEIRETGWTVQPASEPLPVDYAKPSGQQRQVGAPALAREFSALVEVPEEIRNLPSPSGVIQVPETMRGGGS
jgi:hypothetical protein